MAMIACMECGKEISDQAQACPSCGAPNKSAPMKGGSKAILYIIGGIVGLGVLITLFGVASAPSLTQAQKDAKIPARVAIKMCRVDTNCYDYEQRVRDYERTYGESPE